MAKARKTRSDPLALIKQMLRGAKRGLRPVDVAVIRALTGLSQAKFARACGISVHTLRNWEQGRRTPHGPARALLVAIARAPVTVMRALKG
jgi:putative transcriptional regulator